MKYAFLLLALMFAGVVTPSMAQKAKPKTQAPQPSMAQKAKPKSPSQAYKTSNKGYECYAVTERKDCEKCEAKGEYGQVSTPKITCSKCENVSNAMLAKFPCSSCSNTRKVKDPNYVPPRKCEVCNGRGEVLTLGHKIQVADADYTVELNWDDAMYACSNFGGGWRLPTIEELTGMSEFLHSKGKGNFKTDDPNGRADGNWYWSSSEINADVAWIFCVEYGAARDMYAKCCNTYHVRAVRTLP